jgi:peptidylprolyl isomerase
MKRLSIVLCLLLAFAACAPTVPATIPPRSNFTPQPTSETSQSVAALPTAEPTRVVPSAVPGEAQTPAQICQGAVPAQTPANRTFSAPEQVLQPGVDYRAVFCTGVGAVYVDLFEELTPVTINSFVFLAQQGYYNNITFHRVIQDFMAQGGDPTGTGSGGPGYTFQEEFVGFLHYDRPGWLAMARTNQPGSNGSQFFITTAAYNSLDYQYTLFGEVLEGLDVARSIRLRDPESDPQPGTSLDTVVVITDPSTVATSYVAPEPATSQEVITQLQALSSEQMIVESAAVLQVSAALTASDITTAAPESIRAGYETFLSAHNFDYRVTAILNNATCNPQNGFASMTYTVDAYASSADAAAAFADEFLPTVPPALGLTTISNPDLLPNALYASTTQACNQTMQRGLTFYRYGRYIVTTETVVFDNPQAPIEVWFAQFIDFFFGRGLSDAFRRGLR